jgi:excisionase family DNA binding protein
MGDIVKDLTQKVQEQRKNIERKTLSIKEFAEVMGIGEDTARQMCRRYDAPVIRIGNRYRVIISRIDEWLPKLIGQDL